MLTHPRAQAADHWRKGVPLPRPAAQVLSSLQGLVAARPGVSAAEAFLGGLEQERLSVPARKSLSAFWEVHRKEVKDPQVRGLLAKYLAPRGAADEWVVGTGPAVVRAPGGGGVELALPKVMRKDQGRLEWKWVQGSLYGDDEPGPSDVHQGMLGDCYLDAGFSSLATDPARVRRFIWEELDGTYGVLLFHKPLGQTSFVPEVVRVDARLPLTREEQLWYSSGGGRLWVPLAEKACALFSESHGYDGIGRGARFPGATLSMLSGRSWREHNLFGVKPDRLYRLVAEALERERLVQLSSSALSDPAEGMIQSHAYAVLDASPSSLRLEVRNPWGEVEPPGDGVDDGRFELTPERAAALFPLLYVA